MSVFIEKIRLKNYRSCKATELTPAPGLSALIGVNGSGKSNILQGILLLKKISSVGPRSHEPETPVSSCKLTVTFTIDRKPLYCETLIRYTTNERNFDEVVAAEQRWNFREFTRKADWVAFPMA